MKVPEAIGIVVRGLALLAISLGSSVAVAWSNHALCTWPALSVMPELASRSPVKAESLESFVFAERTGLVPLLLDEEAWARAKVQTYPARPPALAFRPQGEQAPALVARFLRAVRVNPHARFALYLQLPPGEAATGRTALTSEAVTVMKTDEAAKLDTFVALHEGESIPVLDVIASGTDEPDYGLDFGLWEDSGTLYGATYGFGRQPFGNPAVEWSSQSPLHLGYFHEAEIVYRAAPFLRRAYPEYRIHLWKSLALFAFRTGHDYWGWRFAGWALHYLQDLTQPYHARVLPGVGAAQMLWINSLDVIGVHGPKLEVIQLVTNRHFALENFERNWMRATYADRARADVGIRALQDTTRDATSSYDDGWPRGVVSAEANEASDAIDAALVAWVQRQYTFDPTYIFGVTESGVNIYDELGSASAVGREALEKSIAPLLENFGRTSRAFVRAMVAGR